MPTKSEEIVYIDNSQGRKGALRVLDPIQSSGVLRVEWKSAETDFTDFALGDVNNDGDSGVIGIRGGTGDGQIVVYDPVVKSGPFDGVFNMVPWRKLVMRFWSGMPLPTVPTSSASISIRALRKVMMARIGSNTSPTVISRLRGVA